MAVKKKKVKRADKKPSPQKKTQGKKPSKKKAAGTKKKAKSPKSPKGRKKSAPRADRGTSASSSESVPPTTQARPSGATPAKPSSKFPSTGSVSKAFPKAGQARNLASAEKMDELFETEDPGPAPPMYESLLVVRDWLNRMPVAYIKKQVASFVYKGEKAGYPCHVIHSACKVSVQALTRDGVPTVEVHSPGHDAWSQAFGEKPFAGLEVLRSHFNDMASRWVELIDYYIELETERGKAKAG